MNILGIGIDIVEINRINKAISRNNKFLGRIFTDLEIEYFKQKNYRVETIAGNFCAKEAIAKALGSGIRGFDFKDIEILRDSLGKPTVKLYNKLYEISKNSQIYVSISHCKEYATANAFIAKKEE